MLTEKLKQLQATKAKLVQLEHEVAAARNAELVSLPAKFGFSDVNAFIAAVRTVSGKRRGRKPGTKTSSAPAAKRRRRAKITDEMRTQVKKLVSAGKTGNEIAKSLGISLPSVQNVKKALGLVKKR